MPNFSRAERLASESIRNACFNLDRFSRSFRLAWPNISPLERLWNGFDSDDELFMYSAPGRALGYFLGGYVPPGTPNWHPVLKTISPKIDTPF